jgi:hypothetical protein
LVGSAFRYSGGIPFDPVALWKLWDAFEIETAEMIGWWYGARFSTGFTREDAIGSHACSLEASRCATNGIPLRCSLFLPVHSVNCV